MLQTVGTPVATELAATLLQGAITAGLAALCAALYARYHRPWFGWFAIAWSLYVTRLLCILSFLLSGERVWLYWHQVTTGWTALVLLWSSIVFLRQPAAQRWYALLALFPALWSYIAIYELQAFIWAALPAVLFLSGATIWTGVVFWRYHRVASSPGAKLLAAAFGLWGLHHLDYPFLRAQGAWTPWGYYLDILFELLVGMGLVFLVLDDLGRGVRALTMLSGDLQRRDPTGDPLALLLDRPLTLPGVRGTAMYVYDERSDSAMSSSTAQDGAMAADLPASAIIARVFDGVASTPLELDAQREHSGDPRSDAAVIVRGRFVRGAGSSADLVERGATGSVADALARVRTTRRPQTIATQGPQPFIAALPVMASNRLIGALVMAGDVRNPFTALNDDFLLALGQQVGAALDQAALDRQLSARTAALEKLSARMVRQHEDERRRLSRELHDETAQVFSAVKMQLNALRPAMPGAAAPRLDRLLELVDTGIRSIRQVTSDLRPSLLDDLGLLPALRSLVYDFSERVGLRAGFIAPDGLPALGPDADLAIFRAVQEALSNVARHAAASHVTVLAQVIASQLVIEIHDDGRGFPCAADGMVLEADGRMGLTGMRERMFAVGGVVKVGNQGRGAAVSISVPIRTTPSA